MIKETDELNKVKKIKVIDSIMGSGKSSYAIQKMNEIDDERSYIYVTPYLDECSRIEKYVVGRKMNQPNAKYGKGSKLSHFKELISKGKDVVTTHSLFSSIDEELKSILSKHNYVLIIDEVMNVIEIYDIADKDKQILREQNMIKIENNKVIWLDEDYSGKFDEVKELSINGNLYISDSNTMFWTFPCEIFQLFDEVFVLTYLFNCQLQSYYYSYFGIDCEYYSIKKNIDRNLYEIIEYNRLNEGRKKLKDLIEIYEDSGKGKLNSNYFVGGKESSRKTELSTGWFSKQGELNRLKKNLYTFFRSNCSGGANTRLWTSLKSYKTRLQGRGYTKGFVPLNIRATNEYQDRSNLAYISNRYMNPMEKSFFKERDIKIDEDLYALSELLQWIWRSRIRNGQPIKVYIPSRRMRELLYKYLDYEI